MSGQNLEAWPAALEDTNSTVPTEAVPSPETVRYNLDLNDGAMRSDDGPVGQGAYRSAKDILIRAEKCTIVGVTTIEGRFYRWDGSKWRGDGEQIMDRDSIPICSVMEVDVPVLRRSVILTPGPCFFSAEVEEGYVCVSVGEAESAVRNGLRLNALVIPGSSRLVIEPARHLERRPGMAYPAPPDVLRNRRGPAYGPQEAYPRPFSSDYVPNGGAPPGLPTYYITAPPSGSSERMADWPSSHAQAVFTGVPSVTPMVAKKPVRYEHQGPCTCANYSRA